MTKLLTTFFPGSERSSEMRMTTDRLLAPCTAHPLVRNFLDGIKDSRIGDTHLALSLMAWQLDVTKDDISENLDFLIFANAVHSQEPIPTLEYLLDEGFNPTQSATKLMEHLTLNRSYTNKKSTEDLLCWLSEHGGLICPDSIAAYKCLAREYPAFFVKNQSKYEAVTLDSYIRSQSLEIREVTRL